MRRASCRPRDPKLRAQERDVFVRRHSQNTAIRLPVVGRRGSEPNAVLCDQKDFCVAPPVDVLAGDPESFAAPFPAALQAEDSSATLPTADPDNPRKLG